MELYHIKQFLAFAECGSLLKAAEIVHTSQPALSRTMKALESELGVPLFVRTKNKLALNEYGRLAVHYAEKISDSVADFCRVLQETYRLENSITIASVAPAPLWNLIPLLSSLYAGKMINSASGTTEEIKNGLKNGTFQIAILSEPIFDDAYFCKKYGTEHLFFCAPKGHRFEHRSELSFSEIDGETMLLMNNIGIWSEVNKKMLPNCRFLLQNQTEDFITLVETSSLPSFSTDITQKMGDRRHAPVTHIPISDKEAHLTYYAVCLKKNYDFLKEFFAEITEIDRCQPNVKNSPANRRGVSQKA